jgi:hypothetical protein
LSAFADHVAALPPRADGRFLECVEIATDAQYPQQKVSRT